MQKTLRITLVAEVSFEDSLDGCSETEMLAYYRDNLGDAIEAVVDSSKLKSTVELV